MMKKSQLRKIIRESIKELIKEQNSPTLSEKERKSCWYCATWITMDGDGNWNPTGQRSCEKHPNSGQSPCNSRRACRKGCSNFSIDGNKVRGGGTDTYVDTKTKKIININKK